MSAYEEGYRAGYEACARDTALTIFQAGEITGEYAKEVQRLRGQLDNNTEAYVAQYGEVFELEAELDKYKEFLQATTATLVQERQRTKFFNKLMGDIAQEHDWSPHIRLAEIEALSGRPVPGKEL